MSGWWHSPAVTSRRHVGPPLTADVIQLSCVASFWFCFTYFKGKSPFTREKENHLQGCLTLKSVCVCVFMNVSERKCVRVSKFLLVWVGENKCVCVCVSCRNSCSSSLTFPGHSVIKWLLCLPPPLFLFSLSFLPLCLSVFTSHRLSEAGRVWERRKRERRRERCREESFLQTESVSSEEVWCLRTANLTHFLYFTCCILN